jgi:hypothetical protein
MFREQPVNMDATRSFLDGGILRPTGRYSTHPMAFLNQGLSETVIMDRHTAKPRMGRKPAASEGNVHEASVACEGVIGQ